VSIGNRAWLQKHYAPLSKEQESEAVARESLGETAIFVVINGKTAGMLCLSDTLHPEAASIVARMHAMGIDVWMATGDNERTAAHVARQLSIHHVLAGVTPAGKEQQVATLQKGGHVVAMVGDGVNDAPALAQADVGIAVGSGTDVAIETADIVLMKSTLRDVATAIDLAKKVMGRIRLNFFWAICYNVVGMPLAAGFFFPQFHMLVPPMFAGAAMAMSSVSVVMSSLLLRCYVPPKVVAPRDGGLRSSRQMEMQMV